MDRVLSGRVPGLDTQKSLNWFRILRLTRRLRHMADVHILKDEDTASAVSSESTMKYYRDPEVPPGQADDAATEIAYRYFLEPRGLEEQVGEEEKPMRLLHSTAASGFEFVSPGFDTRYTYELLGMVLNPPVVLKDIAIANLHGSLRPTSTSHLTCLGLVAGVEKPKSTLHNGITLSLPATSKLSSS